MNTTEHEELESLLGAYVLNAVDALEYRRITKHLATCESCSREVGLLQGPAAELALLPGADSDADELVDRITSALPWRPRRTFTRLSAGIAAVSVVAAGFLGASLLNERTKQDQITSVLAHADRTVNFTSKAGFDGQGHLYIADDKAVLAFDDLPKPGRDRDYQLWALVAGKPTSMTVVDGNGELVHLFDWKGRGDGFAVTIEPDGGSPVPTTDPVLIST